MSRRTPHTSRSLIANTLAAATFAACATPGREPAAVHAVADSAVALAPPVVVESPPPNETALAAPSAPAPQMDQLARAKAAAGTSVAAATVPGWPGRALRNMARRFDSAREEPPRPLPNDRGEPGGDREQYDRIEDNPFLAVASNPRSTFSVDVDAASYGNVRRFLMQGQRPPADAVRIEELVNYFPYALPAPRGEDPIAITTEVAPAPWRPEHRLVRVALKARPIDVAELPPSNLVFLVDVSGSMNEPNKLPLVKRALRLLVDQLRPQDRIAIVVYAGSAGLVLPSTPGAEKARIAEAIDRLEAGGSTAGGEGLLLAYRVAREQRVPNGTNRVILATDGDFNVGPSSDAEMERLVEAKRAEGTYLTVLGFGTGNYQDAKMEKLAKQGNGNYAYVDDLSEARKVLVHELGATLHTVADDVKLQVEFNPAAVRGYRLIGYEDRLLRDEDFADDKKDAGDVGAGHAVTALYEVVPAGVTGTVTLRGVDPLRYGAAPAPNKSNRDELLYVQLRYKRPGESTSRLMTHPVAASVTRDPSADFRFAASVAEFGMLLRNSEHKGRATAGQVLTLARGALGGDEGGYRAEFVRLVEKWQDLERLTASRDR
jgi:Ca-activated chloride channel family protein